MVYDLSNSQLHELSHLSANKKWLLATDHFPFPGFLSPVSLPHAPASCPYCLNCPNSRLLNSATTSG